MALLRRFIVTILRSASPRRACTVIGEREI